MEDYKISKSGKKIKTNMVREKAPKLPVVTDEMYNQCNEENRKLIQDFVEMLITLKTMEVLRQEAE